MRYLERVDIDTSPGEKITGRGLEPVYVVAKTRERAASWARQNRPGMALKFCHVDSGLGLRGLHLRDLPVYVLDTPSPDLRESMLVAGARPVYL